MLMLPEQAVSSTDSHNQLMPSPKEFPWGRPGGKGGGGGGGGENSLGPPHPWVRKFFIWLPIIKILARLA